jgi:uncharacterized protein (TIGR00369 family)
MTEILTDVQMDRRRQWFRDHWETGIPFAVTCGFQIEEWATESVTIRMPLDEKLTAHEGIFHGGALATLADTAATGVVMAGHDFNYGSRIATVSMTVQYLGSAPGEDAIAQARCVRRGRRTNFTEVLVSSATSGRLLTQAVLTLQVSGERQGIPT